MEGPTRAMLPIFRPFAPPPGYIVEVSISTDCLKQGDLQVLLLAEKEGEKEERERERSGEDRQNHLHQEQHPTSAFCGASRAAPLSPLAADDDTIPSQNSMRSEQSISAMTP